MQYKLKGDEDNQVIFKESNTLRWLMWLFGLIGLPILFIGLLSTLGSLVSDEPLTDIDFILTGSGWVFTAAVGIMWTSRNGNPHKIIFDNENGLVRIHQKRKKAEAFTEIPYEEIDGFYIRTKTSTSSSSSSSTRTTRYVVYWIKKDGSIWDICTYGNRSKAEAMQHRLINRIDLTQASNLSKTPTLPENITLKKSAQHVALEWKNKLNAKTYSFMVLFIGFCIIDAGLYLKWQAGEGGTPFFIMTPFLLLILGLLIFYTKQNLSTLYRLVITPQELQFEHINGTKSTIKRSIVLSEIAAISFDFKDVVGGAPLRVLNHQEFAQIQDGMKGEFSFSDIGKLFSMAFKSFQINIDALDVVGKVDLEKILQKVILEKGGIDVL